LSLKTEHLTRIYRLGPSVITAVDNVSLKVEAASFVTIMGPSGSGKTTLLNLLGLNDFPTSGKLFFDDEDAAGFSDRKRREVRLRRMGFIFQTFNLIPTLNAFENVELPMALCGKSKEEQRERAFRLMQMVGLEKRLYHRPKELSAGEMQRVAIARALGNAPKIIFGDEPTGELDSETGSEIIHLLFELCRTQKTTVIVATHDKRLTEAADVIYDIRDGKLPKKLQEE
jgi:ABC-type lipoprotein export system ATPase subunit